MGLRTVLGKYMTLTHSHEEVIEEKCPISKSFYLFVLESSLCALRGEAAVNFCDDVPAALQRWCEKQHPAKKFSTDR